MKTATAIHSAQTVAAATAAQSGVYGVRVDLTALTVNDATIQAVVTNGASTPKPGEKLILNYAFSNNDYNADGAATFKDTLGPSAQKLVLTTNTVASSKRVFTTDKITLRARYIYMWVDYDYLSSDVTLDTAVIS